MIDRDIAALYGVETKRLNEQVKRNLERFPEDFCFQLTWEEAEHESSKSQFATLNESGNFRGKNIKKLPYAFTEQGVAMLSAVLKSDTAVKISVQIMKAFVAMRKFMLANAQFFQRLDNTTKMHDRFLIIDNNTLYHIGASLKDLGKKCFAFEILDPSLIPSVMNNL